VATTARGDGNPGPRRVLSRADNPLVRAVGHMPATVLTKLLVAFVGTVVLLVILGVLGLRVLGDSNDRVVKLGALQQQATAYRQLQTDAAEVRQSLADVINQCTLDCLVSIRSSADRIVLLLSGQGKVADAARLGFVPLDERSKLELIARYDVQLSDVMTKISGFVRLVDGLKFQHLYAEPLADRIRDLTGSLVNTNQSHTDTLISENQSAFADSQRLFIAVPFTPVMTDAVHVELEALAHWLGLEGVRYA
jgi:hypothetical protein